MGLEAQQTMTPEQIKAWEAEQVAVSVARVETAEVRRRIVASLKARAVGDTIKTGECSIIARKYGVPEHEVRSIRDQLGLEIVSRMEHGTRSMYVDQHCRCEPCKAATREYGRQRRARMRANRPSA